MNKKIHLFFLYSFFISYSLNGFIQHENPALFIKGLFKNPDTVGAFFPCSQYAAKEICSNIDHSKGPLRILEIGSGTGALTRQIVCSLQNNDCLDLVELEPDFCKELHANFCLDQRVSLFCGSILDWQPDHQYDVIICSLPFNRFEPQFVTTVLDHIKSLCKPNGMLSYVELMWVTSIKKAFLLGKSKQKLEQTLSIMNEFRQQYGVRTEPIYRNITPIYIHHVKLPA